VLAARINKDGSTGRGSDLATEDELAVLLGFVRKKLGELADQIIEGRIDILPYKLATTSACVSCDFRPVCRFHPRTNHYLPVQVMGRDGTLAQIMGGGADAS
jgi:ATP-dependent helicase/nuclease subunit B